ncbi:MAG: aminopeptidase [Betaproteobacteria bacterium]|nr:MAG: aminopeptidase [Betaproteobacteria bacterium]
MRHIVSNSRFRLAIAACAAAVLVVSLASCQTVGYYSQAAGGQMELWRAAEPIEQLLEDENTDPALRERLELVSEIRTFATEELSLPDSGSYRRYADLERPYVIWNVFAAPELSLEPVTWCFPIAGCVGYRGYFSEEGAQRFADSMRERGFDVYVGGVPAYSTLGWFDDAVLNTFIDYSDTDLAQLIFHELAHQVAYAPGDTTFNESFATAVELEGVKRWMAASGREAMLAAVEKALSRHQDFLDLVMSTREELEVIYQSEQTDEVKRSQKVDAYLRLREGYQSLKQKWRGYSGYDRWFEGPLNNAQIGSVAAYNELVPGFQQLLAANGGDLNAFYEAVTELTKLSVDERRARLGVSEVPCSDCAAATLDAES